MIRFALLLLFLPLAFIGICCGLMAGRTPEIQIAEDTVIRLDGHRQKVSNNRRRAE